MIAPACVVAIVAVLAGEPPAVDDPTQRAERHFERGLEIENAMPKDDPARAREMLADARREYMLAHAAFSEVYESSKDPIFLYARAQAARSAGRCDLALPDYDAFLATGPPELPAKAAAENRKRCTTEPGAVVAPAPTKKPVATPDKKPTPADAPPRRQWVRDPAGGVLVALGGVTGIIGASLIAFAVTRDGSAVSAGNEGEYVNRKDAARIQHRVGIAASAVGGAMLVAGATRWGVLAARERKRRVSAGFSGSRRGAAITVSVWF